jgi:hypothetical protein
MTRVKGGHHYYLDELPEENMDNELKEKTFICEQDGKRYRIESRYGIAVVLREIIEPKLEVGDWALRDYAIPKIVSIENPEIWKLWEFFEIRKASGEVWRATNGQWIKKEPVGDE